jgi:hypothetical protein
MVRKPGLVLSDRLFQRRLPLGSRRHVEGGTSSKRVLFLHGRREGRGGGLYVCLNCEYEAKALERALPIIAEAVAASRLAAWVAERCQVGKVETLRTKWSAVDWVKVGAEVRHLAALAPADSEVEIVAVAGRLRLTPSLLDLFVKLARDQQRRLERAPPFMRWVNGPGGRRILNSSNVVLSDGTPLDRRLNTDDTEVAARRLRLLLWHAKAEGQLPGRAKHEAWRLYGGSIPQATIRLLRRLRRMPWEKYQLEREAAAERLGYAPPTIDWLTNQDEARRQDPVRRAAVERTLRSYDRKVGKKQTPISRSWQFARVGNMLHVHSKGYPIYGRATIDRVTLDWLLPVQNRVAGEAHVKPAVDARKSVKKAADDWRKCSIGSSEAKGTSKALLREQHRFRDALAAVGAKLSKGWAKAVPLFDELPFDEASRPNPEGATSWFVELLRKNPERPPQPLETVEGRLGLLEVAAKRFNVSLREARRCYERAQDITGIRTWSTAHRGKARKSAF